MSVDPWVLTDGDGNSVRRRPSIAIGVFRYDGSTLFSLPNVKPVSGSHGEGPDPGSAEFQYDFSSGIEGAPTTIEEALSTAITGDYTVENGDRIVIQAEQPDGTIVAIFDGFALRFGLQVSPDSEIAHFGAVGVSTRCWDDPISSALVRPADTPQDEVAFQTQIDAHFNPKGLANATGSISVPGVTISDDVNYDQDRESDYRYPIFIDKDVVFEGNESGHKRRLWSIPMAVRYLIYRGNPAQDFVLNPNAVDLNALLSGPPDDDGNATNLIVPDLPITGKSWPVVLYQMINDCGFSMTFRLLTLTGGYPQTVLGLFRHQAGVAKDIYLASRGTAFDSSLFNFDGAAIERDTLDVANAWVVRGGLNQVEISIMLKPLYPSASADGSTASNIEAYDSSIPFDEDTEENRIKYRNFGADECGEGHYAPGSATKLTTKANLDLAFGADNWTAVRRHPIGILFSRSSDGRPYPARLSISKDYAGDPDICDGSGTWQVVADSAFSLLKNRIGIEIDGANPNKWKIGESSEANAPYPDGVVKVVEDMCGKTGAVPFKLKLTCVIEADKRCQSALDATGESPLPWRKVNTVDASDRLLKQIISKYSEFNTTADTMDDKIEVLYRDDTDNARNEARALQLANQSGVLSGTVEIPYFTAYYEVGNRIASINGRDISFRTDGGTGTPIYPVVVGVQWSLIGGQKTILTLSDAGTDRNQYRKSINLHQKFRSEKSER